MDSRVETYFNHLKDKKIAFCGIGGSNLPLMGLFSEKGAKVTACDKREKEALGETYHELEALGVTLKLGESYLDDLEVDSIFRTPGMQFYLPQLNLARKKGITVTSEMEVFFDLCPCEIYGITGSDGKTTTTTIIAELLKASGKTVHIGGNIGYPLLPDIQKIDKDDVVVVELSSFQLISMRKSPTTAVVTNLAPNHLDMHRDMNEYIMAKKNILLHQTADSKTILNADNALAWAFADDVRGQLFGFSTENKPTYGAYLRSDNQIVMCEDGVETEIIDCGHIKIPGRHNVENYLAAITAVWGVVSVESIIKVATEFGGVEHRSELVKVVNGVSYYNDSIGTSPSRTAKGTLQLFSNKIILIAGGYDKKIPYTPLGAIIADKVKTLILMGGTAPKIAEAVQNAPNYDENALKIYFVENMEEAVLLASEKAQSGDVVSLSPASASFDSYKNFEARGHHFKQLVHEL